jgi:hypothetical protein
VAAARTIHARISPNLWSWLERYRKGLDLSRSAVMVDALELLRLDDAEHRPRRDYWELLHQLRAELWRAQAELPADVSDRLDELVRRLAAEHDGSAGRVVRGGASRKELIAALVFDAPASRRALRAKITRYRRAAGARRGLTR